MVKQIGKKFVIVGVIVLGGLLGAQETPVGELPGKIESVLEQLEAQDFPSFELDEILKSLPADEAERAKLQIEELEANPAALRAALLDIISPNDQSVIDSLDGMCVATPALMRLKRVSNAGFSVVFAEFAKEFISLVAATCPEAAGIVNYRAELVPAIRDAVDGLVFLKQYADEYRDLRDAGLSVDVLDSKIFVGFEDKRVAARASLEKMAGLLSGLLEKDFGQFEGMVKGMISIVLQKMALILGDDQEESMVALSALGDLVESFFAEACAEEQAVLQMFVSELQKKLMENQRFVAALQGVRDYVYTARPSGFLDAAVDFVYVEDCDCDDASSVREFSIVYQEKMLFTDLPVTIDRELTLENGVCGRIIRDDKGVATEIVVGENVVVKQLAEQPMRQGRSAEAKMAKRFVVLFSAPAAEAKE